MKAITAPAKRGRPKEERQPVDHGTAELVIRRQLAVGAGDPVLATTPLGIMLARELIDLDQHSAGDRFRSLYSRASNLGRWVALGGFGGETDDETAERIRAQYTGLARHLGKLGRNVMRQIVDVAVFEMRPAWLMFALHNPHKHVWRVVKHHQDCIDLCTGLRELDKLMGRR